MKKNYCKGELLIIGEDVQEQTYLGCGTFQVPVYKVKCKECNHILLTDKSELTIKEDGVFEKLYRGGPLYKRLCLQLIKEVV